MTPPPGGQCFQRRVGGGRLAPIGVLEWTESPLYTLLPMSAVQTVAGAVDTGSLGFTLPHEHLVFGAGGWDTDIVPKRTREERVAECEKHVKAAYEAGVRSIFEFTTLELGRDVEVMREVSHRTGMNIVCSTGLYARMPSGYWKRRTVEEMAEVFVHELEIGIGDTPVRAGIIKTALEQVEITDYEEQVLRAAAMASKATSAPIAIHVESSGGLKALEILAAEGIPGNRIIIAHAESTPDFRYILKIVEGYGAYAGIDRYGLELLQRDDIRDALVAGLCALDHSDRIHVSHDFPCCMLGRDVGRWAAHPERVRNWNLVYVPTVVIPRLRSKGISQDHIDQITVRNPAALFA
jgi:phosphotriesterase-related protein